MSYESSEALCAEVVKVPYGVGDAFASPLCMLFILPHESLKNLFEKWLSSGDYSWANIISAISCARTRIVDLTFPKFKIEFAPELIPILQDLGMEAPFTNSADFGKMLEPESKVKLKPSEVYHGAMIEVDELGTRAAAATIARVIYMRKNLGGCVVNTNRSFVAMVILEQQQSIVPLCTAGVEKVQADAQQDL